MNLYKIISEIKAQLAGIKKNKVGHIQSKIIIGMNNAKESGRFTRKV
jgi:hypothetical protein